MKRGIEIAIAKQVGCSKSGAFKVFKSIEKTGSIAKQPRSGRPRKFLERGERAICWVARKLRFGTLGELKRTVSEDFQAENPSKRLVKHILRKYRLKSCRRKRKPFVSLKNRSYRLKWAKAMLEWPVSNWEDVVFSDGSCFGLKNDSGVLRVWRTTNEASNPQFFLPTFANMVSVMVWGCIGPNGVGKLAICERSVNSKYYQEILENNLKPSVEMIYGERERPFIFQQDTVMHHAMLP